MTPERATASLLCSGCGRSAEPDEREGTTCGDEIVVRPDTWQVPGMRKVCLGTLLRTPRG